MKHCIITFQGNWEQWALQYCWEILEFKNCLHIYILETQENVRRKLRNTKSDSSDESSDEETENALILKKNKTANTGVYDLWSSSYGM